VGCKSTNDGRAARDGQAEEDEPIPEDLAALRGWLVHDEAVHKITRWTTLKIHPTHVGISLAIGDWVGNDLHEIQFWEATNCLPFIGSAAELYNWPDETLRGRSRSQSLPRGMPHTFEGFEVHAEVF
jgi:hypothetical protein